MHKYVVLNVDEQDEICTAFMEAQERDLFCHELNERRYETMLKTLPAGQFRDRITELLAETRTRKEEVAAIIAATVPQMPPAARIATACTRMREKQETRGG